MTMPLTVWWSPTLARTSGSGLVAREPDGKVWAADPDEGIRCSGAELPADAVRLVPDEMDLVDANERLGAALVDIGLILGLPTPTARVRWGADEVLVRARSVRAELDAPAARQ